MSSYRDATGHRNSKKYRLTTLIYAPHTCEHVDCEGNRLRLRLEAADEMADAVERFNVERRDGGSWDVDYLVTAHAAYEQASKEDADA